MNQGIQSILDSAQRHGQDDDPDHEVGDLQIAWELMGEAQREEQG